MSLIEKVLGDCASADLTKLKTEYILSRGYKITGFMLTDDNNNSCLIDRSAVRWLDEKEWWWLMHESEDLIENK